MYEDWTGASKNIMFKDKRYPSQYKKTNRK
jgi:hypothetical protein